MAEPRGHRGEQLGTGGIGAAAWKHWLSAALASACCTGGLAGCRQLSPAGEVGVKEAYFSLGNVELFRSAPEVLVVRSAITDVQYGVLFPFGAAVIVALVSTVAAARGRRRGRHASWALPVGAVIVAAMLGAVGWSAMTIQTTINQPGRMLQVDQQRLWGVVPSTVRIRFDQIDDVRVLYRSGRGAYCAAVLRRSPDDGSELTLFRFVDVRTNRLDLARCEHLRHRLAQALQVEARDDPEERRW